MAQRPKRLIEGDYHIKENLQLDLSDPKHAALVCRALSSETRLQILNALIERSMTISQLAEHFYLPVSSMSVHIHILEEAGLVTSISNPGVRGTKKLCGISASSVVFDLFAHKKKMPLQKAPVYVSMPVGNYSDCEVIPPCGIVSTNLYLYQEDSPYGFYMPDHVHASLVWLTGGYLEYRFPNEALNRGHPSRIQFSFEICAEAPGYDNNWPSDIRLELNQRLITVLHIKGDYGGRRGIYNPSWWDDSNSQFGDYIILDVTHSGCYLGSGKVSDETIESLDLAGGYTFSFRLSIADRKDHLGGMNLFGRQFGDYDQDIIMKVEYE